MRKGFGIITVVLIAVIIFCVKGTVSSKENSERAEANRYYAALEDEYLDRTRDILEEKGYCDCGVTMTRVTMEDGSREYTVLLHHRKLQRLNAEEKNELIGFLADMEFDNDVCRFRYDL